MDMLNLVQIVCCKLHVIQQYVVSDINHLPDSDDF